MLNNLDAVLIKEVAEIFLHSYSDNYLTKTIC